MNILIAPNAFKGSLSALEVADAINSGLTQSGLSFKSTLMPIADGGDGTLMVLASQLGAALLSGKYPDPLRRPVTASYGWLEDQEIAIVEMAEASGIRHLGRQELNPWKATSYGSGLMMREAIEKGAKEIWLSVGGSASVDGGMGILEAMGCVLLDSDGNELSGIFPEKFDLIEKVDVSKCLVLEKEVRIQIFCDVTNPLLGPNGAAAVFGPQKGATAKDVKKLEQSLARLAGICKRDTGIDVSQIKHGGAAGGVSAFLHGYLRVELLDGATSILDKIGFAKRLDWADVLITGEGQIDSQTLSGKGPGVAAAMAKANNKYVVGLCGATEPLAGGPFDQILTINDSEELELAIKHTRQNLVRVSKELGEDLKERSL